MFEFIVFDATYNYCKYQKWIIFLRHQWRMAHKGHIIYNSRQKLIFFFIFLINFLPVSIITKKAWRGRNDTFC